MQSRNPMGAFRAHATASKAVLNAYRREAGFSQYAGKFLWDADGLVHTNIWGWALHLVYFQTGCMGANCSRCCRQEIFENLFDECVALGIRGRPSVSRHQTSVELLSSEFVAAHLLSKVLIR